MMKGRNSPTPVREEGIALLNQALTHFNFSTARLQESYNHLQKRISSLNLELKEKNEQLEASLAERARVKEYLYNIVESLNCGVVVVNAQGNITTCNRAAEEITGEVKEVVEGKSFGEALLHLFPEEVNVFIPLKTSQLSEGDYTLIRSDGIKVQVKVLVTPLRGKVAEGSVIILQDITQLKKLEEQAERTNRLIAMGEIAVGIAHEVRNPLGSIELLASLLRREVEADEYKRRLTDHILTGVKSIDYIISNLLLFSKPQCPTFKKINTHTFLIESLHFVASSLKQHQITLTTHYDPCDPLVWGDAELLKQVVLNLVWNAIHAMPHGGNLVIATEIVGDALVKYAVGDRSSPLSAKGIEGKGYVEIRFTDSGTGISKENKKQIFNPFFTTKEKGTGLGLAIVHKIIEAHRGMIEVESSIGQGSTFTITLPLVGKGTR